MKLNVVLSNNFLDANNTQIDLIGEGIKTGKKQIVIVPEKRVTSQEKRIMERLNLRATFDVKVMTLSSLVGQILPSQNDMEILSKLGAVMLVEMLISQHRAELVCFDKTLLTVAFADSVYAAIMQLKTCGISPQILREKLHQIESLPLRKKMQDILVIYEAYERVKEGKFYDSCDRLNLASQTILAGGELGQDYHFCGIESMTDIEFGVLSALIQKSNSVSIGVMAAEDGQPNADLIKSDVLNKIKSFCKSQNLVPNVIRAKSECADFTGHILRNVLAVTPQKMSISNGEVEIYEAGNPRLEVEFVALDILQCVRGGARYRDFAINCANMEVYEPIIRNVFGRAGIPVWIDAPTALSATEMGKFIFAAVDFAGDGLQAKDIYRFVSNSLCNFTQSERELFENVTTCYGITGESLLAPSKPHNADMNFDKYLELNQKLAPLYEFCEVAKTSGTVAQYVAALNALLDKFNVAQNLTGLAQALKEDGDLSRSGIARQNYKKFESILDTLGSVLGGFECDFAEFTKILRSGVSGKSINPLPMSVDCVRIGQSGTSAFDEVKYYYIMCAIEGNLPSFGSDVGLIADYDIEGLGKVGLCISPTVREQNSLLRQGVINSFCYARERLCVTYPISIDEETCTPASAVTSLMSLFDYKGNKIRAINVNSLWNVEFNPAAREFIIDKKYANIEQILSGYIEGLGLVDMSNERQALQNSFEKVLTKFAPDYIKKATAWRQKPKEIPNLKNPSEVFFTEDKAGVTQIEEFFDCPYAHFLSYGLKIKERKTATMQATDIGTLLHAVLERFGRKLSREGVQRMEDIPSFVHSTFDKLLVTPEFENIAFGEENKALIAALRVEAVRACEAVNYQMQHSKYQVKFIEAKFGTEGFAPIPEIAIVNTQKRVKISGKIDRADVCGGKLRIIDYKTSKNSADFKLLNFYLGKKIQLFYYMAAIIDSLPYSPSGAYYLPVHKEYTEGDVLSPYSSYCMQGMPLDDSVDLLCQDDQFSYEHPKSDIIKADISTSKEVVGRDEIVLKSRGASAEEFDLMLKYARQVLAGAINDIYCGYIEPTHFEGSCEYCKFRNICRKGVYVVDKIRTDNFDVDKTAPFVIKKKEEK